MPPAQALWAAEQARLYATLKNLRAGPPRPAMAERDPNAFRFAVPVLLVVAFAVAWGEWTTRLGEAFSPVAVVPRRRRGAHRRLDRPAAPIRARRRSSCRAAPATPPAQPVSVPEGSKLTVRVVSRDAAEVTLETDGGAAALAPTGGEPSGRIGRGDPQLRGGARPRRHGRDRARRQAPPPIR